jgi:hypothetical protein
MVVGVMGSASEDLDDAVRRAQAQIAERDALAAAGQKASEYARRQQALAGAAEFKRLTAAAIAYLCRAESNRASDTGPGTRLYRAAQLGPFGSERWVYVAEGGRVFLGRPGKGPLSDGSRELEAKDVTPNLVDELVDALGVALAGRERAVAIEAEGVDRMRELGRAFVQAVSNQPPLRGVINRTRPKRFRVGFAASGRVRNQRGWPVDYPRADSPVVLDDGRVGRPTWAKLPEGKVRNGKSEYHQWKDLPWSQELENMLAKWLSDRGITK